MPQLDHVMNLCIDIPLKLFHLHQFVNAKEVARWINNKCLRLKPGLHYAVCSVARPDLMKVQIRDIVLDSLATGGVGAGMKTESIESSVQTADGERVDLRFEPWMPQAISDALYARGINPLRRIQSSTNKTGCGLNVFGNRIIDLDGNVRLMREFFVDQTLQSNLLYAAIGV